MLRLLDQIGAPIRGHRRKSHPATIPRTLLFTTVRRRVDNSLTCPDGSPESAEIRFKHVRNVQVDRSPGRDASVGPVACLSAVLRVRAPMVASDDDRAAHAAAIGRVTYVMSGS